MRFSRFVASAAFLAISLSCPASQAQGQSKNEEAETGAIKQTFADFSENFTRHDLRAVAMDFAVDADFTNMYGMHRHGRQEVEAWMASIFTGALKDARRTDVVRSIRFLTPEMAAVDADTVITGTKAPDGSEVPPRKALMIVIMMKQNGRWVIGIFHEAEFPPARAASTNTPASRPQNQ